MHIGIKNSCQVVFSMNVWVFEHRTVSGCVWVVSDCSFIAVLFLPCRCDFSRRGKYFVIQKVAHFLIIFDKIFFTEKL